MVLVIAWVVKTGTLHAGIKERTTPPDVSAQNLWQGRRIVIFFALVFTTFHPPIRFHDFSSIHLSMTSRESPIFPIWQWFCACSSRVKILAVSDRAFFRAATCL